jgi:hypothetical protein
MKETGDFELKENSQVFKYQMDLEETGYKGNSGIGMGRGGPASDLVVTFKFVISTEFLNPINSDLNTLCVNTALRFKCPTSLLTA